MAHRRSSPLIVLRFSRWHLSEASPVMKLMNSDTHSCTVSLASLEILAFAGRAFFMILLTLAIGRKRSCSRGDNSLKPLFPAFCAPPESLSESAMDSAPIPKAQQIQHSTLPSVDFQRESEEKKNGRME